MDAADGASIIILMIELHEYGIYMHGYIIIPVMYIPVGIDPGAHGNRVRPGLETRLKRHPTLQSKRWPYGGRRVEATHQAAIIGRLYLILLPSSHSKLSCLLRRPLGI